MPRLGLQGRLPEDSLNRRLPAVIGPRYVVRNNNGTFHVFDTVYYGVVDARSNEKAAQTRADELNARPPKVKSAPQRGRRP